MPDRVADHHDVNEAVVAEWVDDTTPFDRVYEIVRRTYDPQAADRIAERARVSPTTARKHLQTLADAGEVSTTQDGRTTRYRRSETAIVTERAQQLLAEHSSDELSAAIAEMKARLHEWREQYDVDSPEEFARVLDVEDADSNLGAVLTDWQTTRRNLALAQAALAIGEATESGHLSDTGDDNDDGDVSITA